MADPNTRKDPKNCDYSLSGENLTALWTEFQKEGGATCPETGAAIELINESDGETTEPTIKVNCKGCGRSTDFKPGQHESFGWAE